MPDCKTSVCVKLMYILFFYPNEQKNCKLCTRINNCDYASSQGWHHFCRVQIIFQKSVCRHTGETSLIFSCEENITDIRDIRKETTHQKLKPWGMLVAN